MDIIIILILAVTFLAIYLMPTWVASARENIDVVPIFIVNLFLGWTLIGWVGALTWAYFDRD